MNHYCCILRFKQTFSINASKRRSRCRPQQFSLFCKQQGETSMALLFKLRSAMVWNNIFWSSQYHSSNDHSMLQYVNSFIRKLWRKISLDCIVTQLRWLYFAKPKAMNKVILTHERIFMSNVVPSGSSKTELMLLMPQRNFFYSCFQKVCYFYKRLCRRFSEFNSSSKRLHILNL